MIVIDRAVNTESYRTYIRGETTGLDTETRSIWSNPGIEIVASQPGDFTREKSLKAMENILQANKQIDAIYSQDDDMTVGIVQAIRDAGRQNEMFIVSSGHMKEVYQMMKKSKSRRLSFP